MHPYGAVCWPHPHTAEPEPPGDTYRSSSF